MFLTKTSCETAVSLFVSVSVSVETCDMVNNFSLNVYAQK